MTTSDAPPTAPDQVTLPLVRSTLLAALPWLRHGITTRATDLGVAEGNVGYTAPRDVEDAWRMRVLWTRSVGLDPKRMVRVRQVHGDAVAVAGDEDGRRGGRPDADEAPIADALVTDVPGLALMTLHADCLPILIADRRRRVVATIHAGWRGTLLDISGGTVRRMTTEFGSHAADLVAFVGPGIGVDAFAVGDEVVRAFEDRWSEARTTVRRGVRTHLDLKRTNVFQLARAGVPGPAIEVSPLCSVADQDRLFSHRAQGALTGRFAAIVGIAPSEDHH